MPAAPRPKASRVTTNVKGSMGRAGVPKRGGGAKYANVRAQSKSARKSGKKAYKMSQLDMGPSMSAKSKPLQSAKLQSKVAQRQGRAARPAAQARLAQNKAIKKRANENIRQQRKVTSQKKSPRPHMTRPTKAGAKNAGIKVVTAMATAGPKGVGKVNTVATLAGAVAKIKGYM